MEYVFQAECYKKGNRAFIDIPFNVWETCGKRGNIPVKITINDMTFECKLIPKGNGAYIIPINKNVFIKLNSNKKMDVKFTILEQLTRINKDSPYNKDNPIRYITSIKYLKQPADGYCGQTCLAMLAGVSVDEVIKIMNSKAWQASISKVIETLDYFGFTHKKPVYTHCKKVNLPRCCIVNVRSCDTNHLILYYDNRFYDPASEVLANYRYEDIISYIEIDDSSKTSTGI